MFAFIFCLSLLTVDFKKNIFEHDTIVVQIVNKKFMNMNTLIKDLNFKCFIQMTSKTDSVDHVKKVCLIRKFVIKNTMQICIQQSYLTFVMNAMSYHNLNIVKIELCFGLSMSFFQQMYYFI